MLYILFHNRFSLVRYMRKDLSHIQDTASGLHSSFIIIATVHSWKHGILPNATHKLQTWKNRLCAEAVRTPALGFSNTAPFYRILQPPNLYSLKDGHRILPLKIICKILTYYPYNFLNYCCLQEAESFLTSQQTVLSNFTNSEPSIKLEVLFTRSLYKSSYPDPSQYTPDCHSFFLWYTDAF